MSTRQQEAFFHTDGEWLVGNDASRGPWSADACHAGPVTAVIARAAEQAAPDRRIVRLMASFERPIPIARFRAETEIQRQGRAATSVSVTLRDAEDRVCAVGSSLHLESYPPHDLPTAVVPHPDFAEAAPGNFPVERGRHGLPFFGKSIEVRYPPGQKSGTGPITIWMRTPRIVEGEDPSPFQRLCPIADCGNGISRNAGFDVATFINPDLTVIAYRLPESDWLASQAISFWEPNGIGMSHAMLFDTRGAIGTALQTLIVRPVE